MHTRVVNQLTARLNDSSPAALDWCANIQQRSSLLFLQTYAAHAASIEQISRILKAIGHPTASNVAPKMFEQVHQPSLQASADTIRTTARLSLLEQWSDQDKKIGQIILSHEDNEVFSSGHTPCILPAR